MYRFFTLKLILSILFTSFFSLLRSHPLQLSLRILFILVYFLSYPNCCLRWYSTATNLEKTKTKICSFVAVKYYLSVLCRLRFYAIFAQGKNYKNIQKFNLVICVFLLLFKSRDHVWPRDAPKRIPRTKNRLSFLVVFAKKVCTQIWVRVSARLT